MIRSFVQMSGSLLLLAVVAVIMSGNIIPLIVCGGAAWALFHVAKGLSQ